MGEESGADFVYLGVGALSGQDYGYKQGKWVLVVEWDRHVADQLVERVNDKGGFSGTAAPVNLRGFFGVQSLDSCGEIRSVWRW